MGLRACIFSKNFANAGISSGGDDYIYAQNIYTGEYYGTPISETLFVGLGITLNPIIDNFEIQLGGYCLFGGDSVGDVDYFMTQFSFEPLFCIVVYDFRLGAGPVFFSGPNIEVTDSSSTSKRHIDPAIGYVISFDYFFINKDFGRLSLGVKYTKVDFEYKDSTWNGDNISLNCGLYF